MTLALVGSSPVLSHPAPRGAVRKENPYFPFNLRVTGHGL